MVKDGRRTRLKPQPPREKEGQSGERFCVARTIQSAPNSWLPIFQGRSVEAKRDNEPVRGHRGDIQLAATVTNQLVTSCSQVVGTFLGSVSKSEPTAFIGSLHPLPEASFQALIHLREIVFLFSQSKRRCS